MADPDDDDRTFHPFGNLPAEVKDMIWSEATPHALVYPRLTGFVFHPRPSVLTQVNRESRSAAYRMGGPVSVDSWAKKSNTTWLNPGHDTVLYSNNILPRFIHNRLVNVPINHRAKQVVLPDNWDLLHQRRFNHDFLISTMTALVSWPCLEEIMIWPQCPPRDSWHVSPGVLTGKHYWPQSTMESVFGKEHLRLVDLTNDAEVNSLAAELLSADIRHDLPHIILRARDLFKGKLYWCPNYWTGVIRACEKGWLLGKFTAATADPQAQHGSGVDPSCVPVDISLNNNQFNRDNPWIRKMLAHMPQPRPVFLLARADTGAVMDGRERRKRMFHEAVPQYGFDDNSRLFKKARDI